MTRKILIFSIVLGAEYLSICEIHCYFCPHIFSVYYFSLSQCDISPHKNTYFSIWNPFHPFSNDISHHLCWLIWHSSPNFWEYHEMYRLQAQKGTNLADLLQFVSQMEWNWARILKKNQSLEIQSNLVIRNFMVTLKLFLNAKCSLSLWSKLAIGHEKWFFKVHIFYEGH